MSELAKRALFGSIYVAVVIAGVFFHPSGLLFILSLIYVMGMIEMKHLQNGQNFGLLYTSASLLGIFALVAHLSFSYDFQDHLLPFMAMVILALFLQHLFSKGSETNSDRLSKVTFSFIYLFLPTSLAISIAYIDGIWQPEYLLGLFIILWANDTAAFLTGKKFGKHKLIERLSPKKSIEGFVGGLIGSLLVGFALSKFWPIMSTIEWIIFSAIVAIFGSIGDLFQSSLKRSAGVKDSGNIIPGHGGILDRLDSFLFSVPIVYFYLRYFTY